MTANRFKVNDVLAYTWGYEQTNCDFFQVVKVTPKTITVREIAGRETFDGPTAMTGRAKPWINRFIGEPLRKTVKDCSILQPGEEQPTQYVSFDYGVARPYRSPVAVSHYH